MRRFVQKLHLLGYIFFISPPKSFYTFESHRAQGGELARYPLEWVLMLELALRAVTLLLLAVCIEYLVGNLWYSILVLDVVYFSLVFLGFLHMLGWYVLVYRINIKHRTRIRVYRLFRNTVYAAIPGLALIPVIVASTRLWSIPAWGDHESIFMYSITFVVFWIAGLIEAFRSTRVPLGFPVEK